MIPLFFQVVLSDSASTAGARLAIPSLATPLGSLLAGVVMSQWGKLVPLMRLGAVFMVFGNALVTSFKFEDSTWKYFVYTFPASFGQGVIYPSILFTSLASFDHAGKSNSLITIFTYLQICYRSRGVCLDGLSDPIIGHRVGSLSYICHSADHAQRPTPRCFERDIR